MSAPEWMNWGGWRWIGQLGACAIGVWFGWTIRAINARSELWRRDFIITNLRGVFVSTGRILRIMASAEVGPKPADLNELAEKMERAGKQP